MRVTDSLLFQSARTDVARARVAAEIAQQQVSTGTRIHHPGDDPAGAGLSVAFQMSSDRLAAIAASTAAASDELNAAEGALGNVSSSLSRARELAVQLSNGTYGASDRAGGATEVGAIFQQVISALNTRFGNRFLFGGARDASFPFDPGGTDTATAYKGDTTVRQVEIAPGVFQPASVRADRVMDPGGSGADVLATLRALQGALAANDPRAVQATLDDLDKGIAQVSQARADVGTSMTTLDTASTAAQVASGDDAARSAKQGEVNLADAAIQLQATQNALQATLAAAAQSFKLSLLAYLG